MHTRITPLNQRLSFRDKARLNTCIAKDLSDNFGGRTADYLRPLNHRLREDIHRHCECMHAKTAVAA